MSKVTELPIADPLGGDEEAVMIQGGVVKRGPFPIQASGQDAPANAAGSLLFLSGNGERQQSAANGILRLTSPDELFKETVAGDSKMFAANSGHAWACVIKLPVEQLNFTNRIPALWNAGTQSTLGGGNDWGVSFYPEAHTAAALKRTFLARVSQAGTGALVRTAQAPANFSGFGLIQMFEQAGSLHLEFTDWITGDKTIGSIAMTAAFAGKSTSSPFAIGGADVANFPREITTSWSGSQNGPMCQDVMMRDFAFIERKLTDAEIISLRDGTPLPAIVGAEALRLYCPLATAGALDLSITSNKPGVPTALTLLGNVAGGSSLVGQSAAKALRLKSYPTPCLVAQEFGATSARFAIQIDSETGLTGRAEARFTSLGKVIKDWHALEEYAEGAKQQVVVTLPDHDDEMEISIRRAGDPLIIATIARVFSCWHWAIWGQSDVVYATTQYAVPAAAYNHADVAGFDMGLQNFFVNRRQLSPGSPNAIVTSPLNPGFYGPGLMAFGRHVRKHTNKPIVVSICAVTGTSMQAWVNDANAGRSGAEDIALCALIANRDRAGAIPVTVNIQGAWEASDIGAADFVANVFPGWLYGQVTNWMNPITRYIYDGTLTRSAAWAIAPPFRFGTGGAKVSDTNPMADIRANHRGAAAVFGGFLGPEATLMYFENNGLAGHHSLKNSPNGDHHAAQCLAETGLIAHGLGTYRGPSRWAHYEFVAGNAAVIVTLDTQQPGKITPNVAGAAITGFEARLTTAGGRSRLNVASATILNGRQIRVDLAGAATPAEFGLWFHSGGPGDYGNAAANVAFVEGGPLFNGWPIIGDNTAIPVKS